MSTTTLKFSTPVQKYCLLDIKVAADEQATQYFKRLNWEEDNTFLDVKLVLGYISAACALIEYLLTRNKVYQEVSYISLYCSSTYFLVTGALYIWLNYVQGKTVFKGTDPAKKIVYDFSTSHSLDDKYMPIYKIALTHNKAGGHKAEATVPFSEFVDDQGRVSINHYEEILSSLVSKLSQEGKSE